jgi:hypothetical protein
MPVTTSSPASPLRRIALLAAAMSLAAPLALHAGAPGLDACDAGFQTVLQPAPAADAASRPDARAYWLDRQLLQWPQAPRQGRYRLYHSANGQIVAAPGTPVAGADDMLVLHPHAGAVPTALAERFGFIAPGAVLSLRNTDLARLPSLLTGQLLLVREDGAGRVLDATSVQLPGVLDDLYAQAEKLDDLGVTGDAGAHGLPPVGADRAGRVGLPLRQGRQPGARARCYAARCRHRRLVGRIATRRLRRLLHLPGRRARRRCRRRAQSGDRSVLRQPHHRFQTQLHRRSDGRRAEADRLGHRPCAGQGPRRDRHGHLRTARARLLARRRHRQRAQPRQVPGVHRKRFGRHAPPSRAGTGRD